MNVVARSGCAMVLAGSLVQGCDLPASASSALQLCADRQGRRVEDRLCQASDEGEYVWLYRDAAGPPPPTGAVVTGASPIPTFGLAYRSASGEPIMPASAAAAEGSQAASEDTVVSRDADGEFLADADVDGHPVTFVVDTGATDVVLSPADAARIGLDPRYLRYDRTYQTANGVGKGASVVASSIRIGQLRISDVAASVNLAPMRHSLLGRAFLDRLTSYRVEHNRLYMR